jgi:transposase-like protein
MTVEKRILISPQDIVGLGFECPHCKASYSVPVTRLDRIGSLCPNCQQRWVSSTQPSSSLQSEDVVLNYFVGYLRELQRRDFGASIRLEIGGDMKLEPKG